MWDDKTIHTKENNQVLKKLWILMLKKNMHFPRYFIDN